MSEVASAVDALAEKVDTAMREHAYSHQASNSPNSFYCSPWCVSEHLRYVLKRELDAAGWTPPAATQEAPEDGEGDG